MLALRLARGAHPLVLLRHLLVAAASAGVGFLLLCTLGYALGHPARSGASLLRLLWCLAPLAATVQLAVAVARTDPGTRPRPGLAAVGLGPAGPAVVAAASTALSCTLGSMSALLVFLHLRGDLTGLPFDGAATELLAADRPLPLAAVLTLLALVPLAAATAGALALRPRPAARTAGQVPSVTAPPAGLPWGVALTAVGLAVEAYADRSGGAHPKLPLPGHPDIAPAWVLAGWLLTALGLALAGPGLVHLCGLLLQTVRPGAVRLLAGRVLQSEARRIGRPLGVVCATVSGAFAAAAMYAPAASTTPSFGPLTTLGAALVLTCTTATLLSVALETRQSRAPLTQALLRHGAPAPALRAAAATRALALLALFAPLTWVVATLAAAPLAP
ncbi:hypothetical protein [Streptomyces sp. NPDC058657]|uniref:hypothetical protein n=1 Tax=unclassified Streptomyces TaxID=2593676 RepID=UPI00365F4D84